MYYQVSLVAQTQRPEGARFCVVIFRVANRKRRRDRVDWGTLPMRAGRAKNLHDFVREKRAGVGVIECWVGCMANAVPGATSKSISMVREGGAVKIGRQRPENRGGPLAIPKNQPGRFGPILQRSVRNFRKFTSEPASFASSSSCNWVAPRSMVRSPTREVCSRISA